MSDIKAYMTKDEIVKRIANEAGVLLKDMMPVYTTTMKVLADIISELSPNERITITGLGSFVGVLREGEINGKPYKTKGVKFTVSDLLKNKMNGR